MPAASRRGSAAVLLLGFAGFVFCSGGNLRAGSAIALLLARRVRLDILNGVTHVFLDHFQLGEHAMRIGWADAVERGRGEFGTQTGELAEQGAGGLLQIEAVVAAVGTIAAT